MTTCPLCSASVHVAWGDGCERCLDVHETDEDRAERLACERSDAAVDRAKDEL